MDIEILRDENLELAVMLTPLRQFYIVTLSDRFLL